MLFLNLWFKQVLLSFFRDTNVDYNTLLNYPVKTIDQYEYDINKDQSSLVRIVYKIVYSLYETLIFWGFKILKTPTVYIHSLYA